MKNDIHLNIYFLFGIIYAMFACIDAAKYEMLALS